MVMKKTGLKQAPLADLMGSSLSRVKAMATGRVQELKREESEALVKKLNIRAEWLVTMEGPMFQAVDAPAEQHQVNQNVAPYGLKPDEVELLDNYRRSPPDGRDVIQKTSAAFARESAVVVGGIPPKKRPGPTITGEAQKSVQKKEKKSE